MNYFKKFLAITLIFVMQFQSLHASIAVGGWGFSNPIVNGATTTWEAVKNGARTTVAISPSSAQVAKSMLRGGLVGLALSAVTQALLDGVDYVMDSAKQELRYKLKEPKDIYIESHTNKVYPSIDSAGPNTCANKNPRPGTYTGNYLLSSLGDPSVNLGGIVYFYCKVFEPLPDGEIEKELFLFMRNSTSNMTIPLTTLATQIINLAEQGNPEAKAYIASVVQDMLEHDEDYRKSLEAQLDAKLKEATQTKTPDNCPSGIRNKNGDCWICSRESHDSIRGRVLNAKVPVEGLAQCEKSMNSSQLLTRYKAYSEFADAREAENRCWLPPDEHHITEAKNARNVANKCNDYLGILGKIR